MALQRLLAIVFAVAAVTSVEAAQCSVYSAEATCAPQRTCQWFLNACINKATTSCRAIRQNKAKCQNTPGCFFYPEPQWYVPKEFDEDNYGDFTPPRIGCDANTMCSRISTANWCSKYSHCGWVDGACKVAGTKPDPNWVADCSKFKPWREQDCLDLGPQCKYIGELEACSQDGTKCEKVMYGCRRQAWCGVSKGMYLPEQCQMLGGSCAWDAQANTCTQRPTASPTTAKPTFLPTESPTKRPTTRGPTKSPTPAPTLQPTSQAPSKNPTFAPTNRPTPPTTFAPTNRPTPPTTPIPTNRPTTAAPTTPKCPVTKGAGTLKCAAHPFAQLEQTFVVPADVVDKEYFCTQTCASGGNQGAFADPVFPGCRAYTFDGTTCRLFGCWAGGSGAYQATVVAAPNVVYGTLSASCYPNSVIPTPAPTTKCTYSNEFIPPRTLPSPTPIVTACKIHTSTYSADFVGDARARLNWCQEGCTNLFPGCTAVEVYGTTAGAPLGKCIYASCRTEQATPITRTIWRSVKTNVCV